jgi:uncharacterized protein (TIGR01777 family)
MRILLTGGTGFIGSHLCPLLLQHGHRVTVLSRRPETVKKLLGSEVEAWHSLTQWQPDTYFDAVINLAGEPVIDKAWTPERKQALLDSRIAVTQQLVAAMQKARKKPHILLSGSAIGIYGDSGTAPCHESAAAGSDFAARLCHEWEQAACKAEEIGVRVVLLRTGLVLAAQGGMLKKMRLPFSLGLGSQLGDGSQMMSWIHLHDYLSAVLMLLDCEDCQGPFNMTAPQPASNKQFSRALAHSLGRPLLLRTPEWALKPVLGERSILLFGGQNVLPAKLLGNGFQFRYPTLEGALENIALH